MADTCVIERRRLGDVVRRDSKLRHEKHVYFDNCEVAGDDPDELCLYRSVRYDQRKVSDKLLLCQSTGTIHHE